MNGALSLLNFILSGISAMMVSMLLMGPFLYLIVAYGERLSKKRRSLKRERFLKGLPTDDIPRACSLNRADYLIIVWIMVFWILTAVLGYWFYPIYS